MPQVDANGYIDHKVDFNENLSESDSNSWCDEASQSYGDEESSDAPVVDELDVDEGQKPVKDKRKPEIVRLLPVQELVEVDK